MRIFDVTVEAKIIIDRLQLCWLLDILGYFACFAVDYSH